MMLHNWIIFAKDVDLSPLSIILEHRPGAVVIVDSRQTAARRTRRIQACTTVEHTYVACPKYSELGSFRIIAYLNVSDGLAAADSAYSTEKSTAWNHTLCTLYINKCVHCVIYSMCYHLSVLLLLDIQSSRP